MSNIELGIDTFGDVTYDGAGQLLPHPQVIRNVVAEAVLADELGLDFIGVGEHHRPDFAISAPDVVLAAIAGQTERIRLVYATSAATPMHAAYQAQVWSPTSDPLAGNNYANVFTTFRPA